ncbi:MAG: hypothetical protein EXQ61_05190, partial [Ilumatobacteraceae bacterium]|nr:hypothetical protein [Ilumatobacteraceae bacterium]
MSRLVALHAGGSREPWQKLGFSFTGNSCLLADVDLTIADEPLGLHFWTIDVGIDDVCDIDGIPTTLVSASPGHPATSRIGSHTITGLDHVVVNTDNLDRTCAAIEAVLGLDVRREREVGNGVVQRFHKLDNTIIEVVTGPHITTVGASLWGMVASIDDLFEYCESLGDDIASP